MQLSKRRLNNNLEKQIKQMTLGVLAEIDSPKKMEEVLGDLLTDAERTAMIKRLAIAVYLDKGRNYENIKNNLKVSSATIAAVAEALGNSGFQELIKRIKAEEWASDWTERISGRLKKILPI